MPAYWFTAEPCSTRSKWRGKGEPQQKHAEGIHKDAQTRRRDILHVGQTEDHLVTPLTVWQVLVTGVPTWPAAHCMEANNIGGRGASSDG